MVIVKNLYQAIKALIKRDGTEYAGYLAFMLMLSLFPFMVFFTSLLSFLGETELGIKSLEVMLSTLPEQLKPIMQNKVNDLLSGPPAGLLTLSVIGTIWTASSSLEALRGAINKAYNVTNPPMFLIRRAFSILELLAFTAIVLGIIFTIILLPEIADYIASVLSNNGIANITIPSILSKSSALVNYTVLIVILLTIAFSCFYFLPNQKVKFKHALPGTILTVVLWIAASKLFGFYLNNFANFGFIYGSLSSIIALMLYLFIINLITILGAEFNNICKSKN